MKNSNRFPSDAEAERIMRKERPAQGELELVRLKYLNDARSILMKKNPVIRAREMRRKIDKAA